MNTIEAGRTAMILYFVSGILFFSYIIFSITIGIVALFGWINMKKLNKTRCLENKKDVA